MNDIAAYVQAWISEAIRTVPAGHVPLLFLSGPQGSGKSTALAEAIGGLRNHVAGASIDDFYLTHAERMDLARQASPLFRTRGPPGTHDLALLGHTIEALCIAEKKTITILPVFDKLADDRASAKRWRRFKGRPDAIVIEGWLMGALPDPFPIDDYASAPPLNAVEGEDRTGDWRRLQEDALSGPYAELWNLADSFCHIVPPGFDCVQNWRLEQEAALWAAKDRPMPSERRDWVLRFIQHYEHITRRMIDGHRRPGAEIHIDADRRVIKTSGF